MRPRRPLARGGIAGNSLPPRGRDGAVALGQGLKGGCTQDLGRAAIEFVAGLFEQGFRQAHPTVVVGLENEGQLPDQVCAESMPALLVGEVRAPAVMHRGAA